MPLTDPAGVIDTVNLTYGQWAQVRGISDPLGAAVVTNFGGVKEGVVRITTTRISLLDTIFPATIAHSVPASVDMEFSGNAAELSAGVLHGFVGDAGLDDASLYINPAAACPSESTDFTFVAERENCDNRMIVVRIHRARSTAGLEIGGSDDYVLGPFAVTAIDDRAALFGGSVGSPLGWVWVSS